MQSTASAAGYSTGGTVGSAFAALLLVQQAHQPWWVVTGMVFFTAALGVFLAIPMKRQMINHEQLPFPSGIAAAETLRSLYSHGKEAMRKAHALLIGMAVGGVFGFLKNIEAVGKGYHTNWLGKAATAVRGALPLPDLVSLRAPKLASGYSLNGLGFEPGVLMIGAGMIMGLRTSISMLIGSFALYYLIAPGLLDGDLLHKGMAGFHPSFLLPEVKTEISPRLWGVWGGTGLMVFSSLTAFAFQWKTLLRSLRFEKKGASEASDALARIEVPSRWLWIGLIPITIGLVFFMRISFQISVPLGLLAVAMSFFLALVACRATGETDTTPIGAMGKVTQLVYAMLARNNTVINLMSAGTTSAAAGSAADLLTDLKSGYLLGANPRKQFLAQFYGIFFGTVAIVPAWYLLIPDRAALDKFPMPAASAWKAMADLLSGGISSLPTSAVWAVVVGSLLGLVLPTIEFLAPRARRFLPSAMGLGLGMVVEFSNSLGFTIGAVIAWVWMRARRQQAESFNVPLASGFVAGESLVAALLTILCALGGLLGWAS